MYCETVENKWLISKKKKNSIFNTKINIGCGSVKPGKFIVKICSSILKIFASTVLEKSGQAGKQKRSL